MRYLFAREGVDTVINNHLRPGSLKWEEESLPITWQGRNTLQDIIGTATELRREDDGCLTAEVLWNSKGQEMLDALGVDVNTPKSGAWLTIYANHVEEEHLRLRGERMRVIHSATLRYLYVVLCQEDPWKEK